MAAIFENTNPLWGITSFFNPLRYERKLSNYRSFRERLTVPLVTVELSYHPTFELNGGDAEILIQLRGRDILWQKERLLNVALQAVPTDCNKVVWLDCDVVFDSDDWPKRTSLLLDKFPLVQPFSYLHRMPNYWRLGDMWPIKWELRRSVPFLIASGTPVEICLGISPDRLKTSPGCVWAAHRNILEEFNFYDACIVGGGDNSLLHAAYGYFEDAIRLQRMNAHQRKHYLAWARRFYEAVRGRVGFIEGNLLHLWHGSLQHRYYRARLKGLDRFHFDPAIDIAVDHNGAWRWNSAKPEMHDYVRNYFAWRREDG